MNCGLGRPRLRISVAAAATVLAVMVVAVGATAAGESDKVKGAGKHGDTVRVHPTQMPHLRVHPVELGGFRAQRAAIGQIAFNEDATTVVISQFSGRVTAVSAKLGDQVRFGSPLFEIDSPEVVQAQTELITAVQGLQKSRAQLAFAKSTLSRQTDLVASKASSVRELEQAKSDFAGAESDVKTAEGVLLSARNKLRVLVGRSEEEIARVEQTRVVNPKFVITAPIAGTVVGRKIGPGQYVRSDSTEPLYTISDLNLMWLKASVPENDIQHVRIGQELEVRVPALQNQTFKARVSAIGAAADPATRRVVVRSQIVNPDGLLRAEMFATFQIWVGEPKTSPTVQLEAIIRDGADAIVWVEREPLVFERRKVTIGLEQDGAVQVISGLKVNERVVQKGAIFVDQEWHQ